MTTDEKLQAIVRDILGGVATHHLKTDEWWGNDTNCGTDAEVVGYGVQKLKQLFLELNPLEILALTITQYK